jgi:hypothetical protein
MGGKPASSGARLQGPRYCVGRLAGGIPRQYLADARAECRGCLVPRSGDGIRRSEQCRSGVLVWRSLCRSHRAGLAPAPDGLPHTLVDFDLIATSILLVSGFFASWKNGTILAGGLSGIATTALAALVSTIGTWVLLGIWHDPTTLRAIEGSGGLEEVFSLPVMLILPGVAIGGVGGAIGATAKWLFRRWQSAQGG